MKRSDIRTGMQAWFSRGAAKCPVTVTAVTDGLFIHVRYPDGGERLDVLPSELEPRKVPSALRRKFALRDVVTEYEAAGGVVKVGERDRLRKAEGGE